MHDGKSTSVKATVHIFLERMPANQADAPRLLWYPSAAFPEELIAQYEATTVVVQGPAPAGRNLQMQGSRVGPQQIRFPQSTSIRGHRSNHRARVAGETKIAITITPEGKVVAPVILETSSAVFDRPIVAALLQRRYVPATRDDLPVPSRHETTIQFGPPLDPDAPLMPFAPSPLVDTPFDQPASASMIVPPVYPIELLDESIEGHATADIWISADGRPTRIEILDTTRPEFGHALSAALQMCQFEPAKRDGEAIPFVLRITEKFDTLRSYSSPTAARDMSGALLLDMSRKELKKRLPATELDQLPRIQVARLPRFPLALIHDAAISEGTATVSYTVDSTGQPRALRIVEASTPELGYAAVQAIALWGYEIPRKASRPAATTLQTTLRFSRTQATAIVSSDPSPAGS